MKKIIAFVFVAVAMLCSCEKGIDTLSKEYSIKVLDEDMKCVSAIFKCDDEGIFRAEDDHAVRDLVAQLPADVRYEILYADGSLMCSSEDMMQSTGDGFEDDFIWTDNATLNGVHYFMFAGLPLPAKGGRFYPYDSCGDFGEPLTRVLSCNNYWFVGDAQDVDGAECRCYCYTSDLNGGCGPKSYYTRLFFGGYNHHNSRYCWIDQSRAKNTVLKELSEGTEKAITGLRLLKGDGSTPALEITDTKTGIKWTLAEIFFDGDNYYTNKNRRLGADMNDGAKGDWLYLYVTRDVRTGRKLMLVNPHILSGTSVHTFDNEINAGVLGCGLVTWHFKESALKNRSNVTVKAIMDAVRAKVDSQYKSVWEFGTGEQRIDFIRLYDMKMNPIDEDLPASFNRNARGSDEYIITYNFITKDDTSYWNLF